MDTFLKVYVRRNRIMISGKGGTGRAGKWRKKSPLEETGPAGKKERGDQQCQPP